MKNNFVDIFNTQKKYNIIYADPPWKYRDKRCNGNCEQHYKTMDINDISKLPIQKLASKDCILFLWATYPQIKEALQLIENWGFRYKTIGFQWIKLNKKTNLDSFKYTNLEYEFKKTPFFGLGRWTRGNTECCLIATKGKPKRINKGVSQLIFSKLEEHSKKPNEVRERIVSLMGDLPRIELFAREQANGWDCWGNEV